jgi:hypothetical protein
MRLRSWTALCALVPALCALDVSAAEPRLGKFVAYQAGKFNIVTSRGEAQVRDLMDSLAQFQATLEVALRRKATDNGVPTHIYIVGKREWEKYLQPREGIAGLFVSRRFANYILIDGDTDRGKSWPLIFHEYTHFFLRSQFAGDYPPWFNEGLAEMFSEATFKNGMATFGIPIGRVLDARNSKWIPFDRLLAVDESSPEYQSHSMMPGFYGQAWYTVHYGMLENRQFGQQMFAYINQLNFLVPREEAARATFGEDLAAIDKQLLEYSRRSMLARGGLKVAQSAPLPLSAGVAVSELDALAAITDLMIETRVAPDRIRPMVESLSRREPNSARTAILAARLALFEENYEAFDAAVARATPLLADSDWLSRRELAGVLLDSALDFRPGTPRSTAETERELGSAMRWFGEAIAHNNQDVEALWGFGTAAMRLDRNLDLAEQALLSAYKRAPGSADIAMSLASLKGQQQQPEAMIPFLKDSIRYAYSLPMRQWATDTLEETQKYVDERNKADEEDRKQREEYEKKRAEYDKKYGKPKKKSGG